MSLQQWHWSVRIAEGGSFEAKAPPHDINILLISTQPEGSFGHQLSLTWRNGAKYDHAEKFVSDQYRRSASRPRVLWSAQILPDLLVEVTLDHPDAKRGEDVKGGGVFRVAYRFRGKHVMIEPAPAKAG